MSLLMPKALQDASVLEIDHLIVPIMLMTVSVEFSNTDFCTHLASNTPLLLAIFELKLNNE